MTIKAKHPVREAFAGCSTSNNYYETKGHAFSTFRSALVKNGFDFDCNNCCDMPGDEGRAIFDVFTVGDPWNDPEDFAGTAVLYWYRMPSGRYEVIGYLA
jgi:hypothetical protein